MIRTLDLEHLDPLTREWMLQGLEMGLADPDNQVLEKAVFGIRRFSAGEESGDLLGLGSHVIAFEAMQWHIAILVLKDFAEIGGGDGYRYLADLHMSIALWDRFTTLAEYEAFNGDVSEMCDNRLGIYECEFGMGHGGIHGVLVSDHMEGRMVWWENATRIW